MRRIIIVVSVVVIAMSLFGESSFARESEDVALGKSRAKALLLSNKNASNELDKAIFEVKKRWSEYNLYNTTIISEGWYMVGNGKKSSISVLFLWNGKIEVVLSEKNNFCYGNCLIKKYTGSWQNEFKLPV